MPWQCSPGRCCDCPRRCTPNIGDRSTGTRLARPPGQRSASRSRAVGNQPDHGKGIALTRCRQAVRQRFGLPTEHHGGSPRARSIAAHRAVEVAAGRKEGFSPARCQGAGHGREHDDILVVERWIAERDRPARIGLEGQLAARPVGDAAVAAVAVVERELGEHPAHAEFGLREQAGRSAHRFGLAHRPQPHAA